MFLMKLDVLSLYEYTQLDEDGDYHTVVVFTFTLHFG